MFTVRKRVAPRTWEDSESLPLKHSGSVKMSPLVVSEWSVSTDTKGRLCLFAMCTIGNIEIRLRSVHVVTRVYLGTNADSRSFTYLKKLGLE